MASHAKQPSKIPNAVKLMLYFDEAHILTSIDVAGSTKAENRNLMEILCWTLEEMRHSSVFGIFLSTNSSMARFAPRPWLARSARVRNNANDLQAPVTEIPFDCSPGFPLKMDQMEMKELYEVAHLAKFGRPL